jgi:hypothetical protein
VGSFKDVVLTFVFNEILLVLFLFPFFLSVECILGGVNLCLGSDRAL